MRLAIEPAIEKRMADGGSGDHSQNALNMDVETSDFRAEAYRTLHVATDISITKDDMDNASETNFESKNRSLLLNGSTSIPTKKRKKKKTDQVRNSLDKLPGGQSSSPFTKDNLPGAGKKAFNATMDVGFGMNSNVRLTNLPSVKSSGLRLRSQNKNEDSIFNEYKSGSVFAPLPTKTKYYKDEIIKELNLTAALSDKLLKTQD